MKEAHSTRHVVMWSGRYKRFKPRVKIEARLGPGCLPDATLTAGAGTGMGAFAFSLRNLLEQGRVTVGDIRCREAADA